MVTQEQIDFYNENGYLHVPGLVSPDEAEFFRNEGQALIGRLGSHDTTWGSARELTGEKKPVCNTAMMCNFTLRHLRSLLWMID